MPAKMSRHQPDLNAAIDRLTCAVILLGDRDDTLIAKHVRAALGALIGHDMVRRDAQDRAPKAHVNGSTVKSINK